MAEAKRESVREFMLAKNGSNKRLKVTLEGKEIEIREPSGRERAKIYKAATVLRGTGENAITDIDPGRLNAMAVITCCIDPSDGSRIFGMEDLDALQDLPASVLDRLAKPILEFMGESDSEGND